MYQELFPITYYFYPLLEGDYRLGGHRETLDQIMGTEVKQAPDSLIYLHIPYCHDLCQFCPFHIKIANGDDVYRRYTDALCREMELLAQRPYVALREFQAIYFGGGSPSILPVGNIRKIFETLHRCFKLAPDVEVSFEGEPRTLGNPELLELLKEFKTRRLSFGLQTYDELQRKRFKIVATLADVDRVTENARKLGFDEINVDMMYDLPGQTVTTLEEDFVRLKASGFDSVDYYNLHYFAFPKNFKHAMERGEIPAKPNQDMHFALAQEIRWRMQEMGFRAVADQVYSVKDRVCEYFRILWGGGYGEHRAETLAVGSSARGYLQGIAYMNTGDVNTYVSTVSASELPVAKISARLETPENRGAVFMSKFFSISKQHQAAIESIPASLWKGWSDSGLIRETPEAFVLTERGRLWTTNIMRDSLELRQQELAHASLDFIEKKPGVRTGTF